MALIAKNNNSNELKEGKYQAVCYAVWNLGIQKSSFNDHEVENHKVIIAWEIDKLLPTGQRFTTNREYTLSLDRKSMLKKHLEGWRGKAFSEDEIKFGFDVEKVKGINCQLELKYNDRGFIEVTGIEPCPPDLIKINFMKPTRKDNPPDYIQKKIDQGVFDVQSNNSDESDEDKIPF